MVKLTILIKLTGFSTFREHGGIMIRPEVNFMRLKLLLYIPMKLNTFETNIKTLLEEFIHMAKRLLKLQTKNTKCDICYACRNFYGCHTSLYIFLIIFI